MTYEQDPSDLWAEDAPEDLRPVDHLEQLIANATGALMDLTAGVGNVTSAEELWRLLERLRTEHKVALANAESQLVTFAHVAIKDLGGELTLDDGRVVEAGWQSGSADWDSVALASRLAAASADLAVDRETGEVLPPFAFAERVVQQAVRALGAVKEDGTGASSASWRIKALENAGIKDCRKYRETKPGHNTVDVKKPKRNTKPAPDTEVGEAAA